MSYVGLVSSESSSGETRRQGKITKTGSKHTRRLLVEAAWHYRKTPARGVTLQRRQEGQPATVIAISWQAQQRLHRVWRRLAEQRGKRSTIVAVAIARELAGAGRSPTPPTDPGPHDPRQSVDEGGENPPTRESISDLTVSSQQPPGRRPRPILDSTALTTKTCPAARRTAHKSLTARAHSAVHGQARRPPRPTRCPPQWHPALTP